MQPWCRGTFELVTARSASANFEMIDHNMIWGGMKGLWKSQKNHCNRNRLEIQVDLPLCESPSVFINSMNAFEYLFFYISL